MLGRKVSHMNVSSMIPSLFISMPDTRGNYVIPPKIDKPGFLMGSCLNNFTRAYKST